MKKFKKLIPAFCAMLLSACMLGTTTYAWFSVNKKVTATGLSVTAQANTQYFVIETTTAGANPTAFGTVVTKGLTAEQITQPGAFGNTNIYPAAYGKVQGTGDKSGEKFGKDGWWTANVNTWDSANPNDIINATDIEVPSDKTVVYENNKYFVGYTFYLGLNAKSDSYKGYLKVKDTLINDETNTEGVAKVAAVKFEQFAGNTYAAATAVSGASEIVRIESPVAETGKKTTKEYELSAETDAQKFVKVTVYLFIDGNNLNVTDASTKLTGQVSVAIGDSADTSLA